MKKKQDALCQMAFSLSGQTAMRFFIMHPYPFMYYWRDLLLCILSYCRTEDPERIYIL